MSEPEVTYEADLHVVVGDEGDTALEARLARECGDLRDQLLAPVVGRMGLAADHDLDGELREPVRLLEEERRTLVCGEAAGEADRQPVRVELDAGPVADEAR